MNRDQFRGTAKGAKGRVREVAGRAAGDLKLETAGKADQLAGKVQKAVGGAKKALRAK